MTGDSENAESDSLLKASEFACEILAALATGDHDVLCRTIGTAIAAAAVETELLPLILVAQALLARAALLGGVAENLGSDASDEEFDRESWLRLEALFATVKRLGPTTC